MKFILQLEDKLFNQKQSIRFVSKQYFSATF